MAKVIHICLIIILVKIWYKVILPYFCTPKNGAEAGSPHSDDSVAQLVEQYTFNVWVLGSSPSGITS